MDMKFILACYGKRKRNYEPDSDEVAHTEITRLCTDHQGVICALEVQKYPK